MHPPMHPGDELVLFNGMTQLLFIGRPYYSCSRCSISEVEECLPFLGVEDERPVP